MHFAAAPGQAKQGVPKVSRYPSLLGQTSAINELSAYPSHCGNDDGEMVAASFG